MHKYVEIKQHATDKRSMGHRKIRGEILKISRQIEMEIQQNVWDTGKIVLRRKFSDKYVH